MTYYKLFQKSSSGELLPVTMTDGLHILATSLESVEEITKQWQEQTGGQLVWEKVE